MPKRLYPFLNAKKRKPHRMDQYYGEIKSLGEEGVNAILDKGKEFSKELTKTLVSGGAAIFPHTFLSQCGYQIAASVNAVLDSGSDQVLVLGILHPMNEVLLKARIKELNEEDISKEASWGVFGPGLDREECLKDEFSLDLFKVLLNREVERRGIKAPKVFERYPSLVNRDPERLPGIRALEKLYKDSVVVATDDMCHHGIGYGLDPEDAFDMNAEGYQFAKKRIEEGYALLQKGAYRDYFFHWMDPRGIGDPTDVAVVLKHLIGEIAPKILDLKLVDVSMLFENDIKPSWVAATLAQFKKR